MYVYIHTSIYGDTWKYVYGDMHTHAPTVSPAEAISSSDPVDSIFTHICLKKHLSSSLCIHHKCTSLYIDRCAPIVSPAEAISSSDPVDSILTNIYV